jgi:hypothetical protein
MWGQVTVWHLQCEKIAFVSHEHEGGRFPVLMHTIVCVPKVACTHEIAKFASAIASLFVSASLPCTFVHVVLCTASDIE